ncbi:hypothetical protein [Aquibacillus kalidii]|uniref:hypothetical protein n=1 Tax=Aquibacillus kalidii TaxID=2762597 RepID=UPI001C992F5F|nr:hypothetical protein [Aquibacillus kalidii]
MKKPKRLLVIIVSLLVATMLSACVSGTEEPKIKIHSGSEELNPIYYGDINNKEQEEMEERLKDFMVGKRFSDLPTVAYGDKIQVEALNFKTEEIEIYDYVVDENANIISEYAVNPLSVSTVEEGIATFSFEEIIDFDTYQDYAIEGKLIHALLIRCEIDGNTFAFSTLVLGD